MKYHIPILLKLICVVSSPNLVSCYSAVHLLLPPNPWIASYNPEPYQESPF